MAGGQGQRNAAIALKDTFGKAADDITGKTADFHDVTADSALKDARSFSNVDGRFGDRLREIKPSDDAPTDVQDPAASPPPADAGAPRGWPPGSTYADVAGVYIPGARRLLINSSGVSASVSVPLHEFGHGADAAYGDLSGQSEWRAVQDNVTKTVGKDPKWTHYYDHPQELFAEGFAS